MLNALSNRDFMVVKFSYQGAILHMKKAAKLLLAFTPLHHVIIMSKHAVVFLRECWIYDFHVTNMKAIIFCHFPVPKASHCILRQLNAR